MRKINPLHVAALGAGLVIGSQIPLKETQKHSDDPIARTLAENPQQFADFEPTGSVDDRRNEPSEIAHAMDYSELEPDSPINDTLATSPLAENAGAHDIEKSPLQIIRERKARAANLAQNAHDSWLRERNKRK